MATGPRSTSRPGGAPGRAKPRTRKPVRTAAPSKGSAATVASDVAVDASGAAAAPGRRSSLTARAIALAVVLLILTISYATSLRIYFSQAHAISATRTQIAERQQRIADLQSELNRWNDSDYVKTQARDRLGWVVPGETGFKVVDADGKPLGGGAEIIDQTAPDAPAPQAWWDKLWGSVEAADKPAPAKAKSTAPKKITVETKPR